MRILQLVHQYPPEFLGGTELYTQALSRALVARGEEVGVFARAFSLPPGLHTANEEGVALFRASTGAVGAARRFAETFGNRELLGQWQHTLETFAPDLVLVHHLMGLPAALLALLRRQKIPYIVTLLDYWWVCANGNLLTNDREEACDGPRAWLNCTRCAVARAGTPAAWIGAPALTAALAGRAALLHAALAGAHLLVTPSDFVTDWYRAHNAPARVETARWGILPPETALPARLEPTAGAPLRLLYVGGLAPNKGVHSALQALQGLAGEWRLQIAGNPGQRPDYVESLRSLAGPRVEFVGALGRDAVWQAMATADIVLVPSLWHETFCLVAHEAVAARAVPFVANMGALREVVQDGLNGRVLPAGDVAAWRAALQAALDDRAALERLRAALPAPRLFDAHVSDLATLHRSALTGEGRTPA